MILFRQLRFGTTRGRRPVGEARPPDRQRRRHAPGRNWAGPVVLALALTWLGPPRTVAQDDEISIADLAQRGQEWLDENVDGEVLEALGELDVERLDPLLRELQRRFQGDYVIDLAAFRDSARALVTQLDADAETRPYAVWLRTRLDYFDVAEQFREGIPPPPAEAPLPTQPAPNPAPEIERNAWRRQVEKRPAPSGAAALAARLKPRFEAKGVPPELVWVAEVESSFNPTARSPAGAAGLYQLMPATAQSLGLDLRPKDQRFDPERSAEAAAKYLRSLHARFGDWRLALAAYNAGEGRVGRLMKRHKASSYDAIARHLPAETQMYVPKIEAVVRKREGTALADLKPPSG